MPANPVPIDVKTKGQTWLLPPYNWSHRRIAKELDVSPSVVSKWRNELVESGLLPTEPLLENTTTDYSAEQRFFIVIETATMSERELAEYCRSKGLFVDDVKAWRALSIKAQSEKQRCFYERQMPSNHDRFIKSDCVNKKWE